MTNYRHVTTTEDVDEEILSLATSTYDSFYANREIDWIDFLDRMDGAKLENGDTLDLDASLVSPAIVKIKNHVRQLQKAQ